MNYAILAFDANPNRGEHLRTTVAAQLPASFQLIHADTPAQAYDLAIAQRVVAAIIVLEPEGEGLTLARELREHNPRLTVLCVRYPDTPTFQHTLVEHLGLPVVVADPQRITKALQRLLSQQRVLAFAVGAQLVQHEVRHLRTQMEAVLSQLNDLPGVEAALLADFSGMPLAQWERMTGAALQPVAGLAAGAMSATAELAALLGARTSGSLIIQEFDEQTVIVARIARQHVLILVVAPDTALGAIRIALRRIVVQLEPLVRGNLLRLRSNRPAAKARSS